MIPVPFPKNINLFSGVQVFLSKKIFNNLKTPVLVAIDLLILLCGRRGRLVVLDGLGGCDLREHVGYVIGLVAGDCHQILAGCLVCRGRARPVGGGCHVRTRKRK